MARVPKYIQTAREATAEALADARALLMRGRPSGDDPVSASGFSDDEESLSQKGRALGPGGFAAMQSRGDLWPRNADGVRVPPSELEEKPKKRKKKKPAEVWPAVPVAKKKAAPKKAEPKKAEPKKAEPKKAEPKKSTPKKAEPRKVTPKKAESRKATPKEAEPKKEVLALPAAPPATAGTRLRGDATTIETPTREIPARYEVWELASLVPSHNPLSWSVRSEYPVGCQQRDYTNDRSEQGKVETGAQKLKSSILLSDDPTPISGPPIVVEWSGAGIVLGGNGRTMMMQLASAGEYARVSRALVEKAEQFGLDPSEVDEFDRPVLVRVPTAKIPIRECAKYSNLLNAALSQSRDVTTDTIASARQLSISHLELIGDLFAEEDTDTIAEVLRSRRVEKQVVQTFRAAEIITPQNVSEWLDPATSSLSDLGRLRVEKVLLGSILRNKKLVDAAQSYTSKIVQTLPLLLRAQRLPGAWDLTPDIEQAIELESRRRATGQTKADFTEQIDAFSEPIPERTLLVWDALDQGPRLWKRWLDRYVTAAERESSGDTFGFDEPMTPEQVIAKLGGDEGLSDSGDMLFSMESVDTGLYTLQDVIQTPTRPVRLSPTWQRHLGSPTSAYQMLVSGPPGGGKSTYVLQLSNELTRLRTPSGEPWKVLYAASEESPFAGGFRNRSRLSHVYSDRIFIADTPSVADIRDLLDSGHFRAVIYDSWQTLTMDYREMMDLLEDYPQMWSIVVAQAVAGGRRVKGHSNIEHKVGAVVMVRDGVATLTKNRFGPLTEMRIFNRRR